MMEGKFWLFFAALFYFGVFFELVHKQDIIIIVSGIIFGGVSIWCFFDDLKRKKATINEN